MWPAKKNSNSRYTLLSFWVVFGLFGLSANADMGPKAAGRTRQEVSQAEQLGLTNTGDLDSVGRRVWAKFVHAPTEENSMAGYTVQGYLNERGFQPYQLKAYSHGPGWETGIAPIPPSRALVPYGGGTAEDAVTSVEGLLRKKDLWRPSMLERTMKATQGTFKRAQSYLADPANQASLMQSAKNAGGMAKTAGAGFATFYFAMGLQAGIQCTREHPENPVACDDYLATLTDPMGLAMTAGFMFAAGPVVNKVMGISINGKSLSMLPAFPMRMAFGVASMAFLSYALNPDMRQCLGGKIGMGRDLAACDRLYQMFTAESLEDTWVPALSEIMTSMVLFQALWSSLATSAIMQSLPILRMATRSPAANIISTLAFGLIYEFTKNKINPGQMALEHMTAYGAWGRSAYGSGIQQSEANMYSGWSALKQANFVDIPAPPIKPLPFIDTEECRDAYYHSKMDVDTMVPMPDRCVPPRQPLDFAGVINHYAELQEKFRSIELSKVSERVKQWVKKVLAYHTTMNASYGYYTELLQAIARQKANPDMKPNDPAGFNPMVVGKMQNTFDLVVAASKASAQPFTVEKTGLVWPLVGTSKFTDFIVASMACGPEAESYSAKPDTLMTKTGNVIADYITGWFSSHDRVSTNASGMRARFFPPRIVNRLPGAPNSICDDIQHPHSLVDLFPSSPVSLPTPDRYYIHPHMFSDAGSYRNIYEYIVANVREPMVAGNAEAFGRWWGETLTPIIQVVEKNFRDEYSYMLEHVFKPALTRPDYYFCGVSGEMDGSLTSVMSSLSPGENSGCDPGDGHRLAYGIANSVHDELRTYLGLIVDMEVSLASKNGEDQAVTKQNMIGLANAVLGRFDQRLFDLAKSDRNKPPGDVKEQTQALTEAWTQFRLAIQPHHPELSVEPNCGKGGSTATNLYCRVKSVFATSDQYLSSLSMFDEDYNPQAVDKFDSRR